MDLFPIVPWHYFVYYTAICLKVYLKKFSTLHFARSSRKDITEQIIQDSNQGSGANNAQGICHMPAGSLCFSVRVHHGTRGKNRGHQDHLNTLRCSCLLYTSD